MLHRWWLLHGHHIVCVRGWISVRRRVVPKIRSRHGGSHGCRLHRVARRWLLRIRLLRVRLLNIWGHCRRHHRLRCCGCRTSRLAAAYKDLASSLSPLGQETAATAEAQNNDDHHQGYNDHYDHADDHSHRLDGIRVVAQITAVSELLGATTILRNWSVHGTRASEVLGPAECFFGTCCCKSVVDECRQENNGQAQKNVDVHCPARVCANRHRL